MYYTTYLNKDNFEILTHVPQIWAHAVCLQLPKQLSVILQAF